jgi:hypothetical protein
MSQSKQLRFSALALGLLLASACTGERASITSSAAPSSMKISTQSRGCAVEDLATFERLEGEQLVHVERDELPRGLYLASISEVLVEKKTADGLSTARILAREIPGSNKAEIVCSDHVAHFGEEFEMTVTGLVKFDTGFEPKGAGLVARQFYVFAGHDRHGVILSNADLYERAEGLPGFLKKGNAHGQVVKAAEDAYALRFTRERDGSVARMFVRLDRISN